MPSVLNLKEPIENTGALVCRGVESLSTPDRGQPRAQLGCYDKRSEEALVQARRKEAPAFVFGESQRERESRLSPSLVESAIDRSAKRVQWGQINANRGGQHGLIPPDSTLPKTGGRERGGLSVARDAALSSARFQIFTATAPGKLLLDIERA